MKNKWHVDVSFKWFDFWIGLFLDKPAKSLYICLLPMLPIKVWITEHEACPDCGAAMQKTAVDISPEGFDLFWNCEACENRGLESTIDLGWPFHDEWMSARDLEHFGYVVK